MFNSLRNRLTLVFIGLAVIPLLGISIFLGLRSFSTLEEEALISQGEKAQIVGTETRAFLEARQNELQTLVAVQGLQGLDVELKNLLAIEPFYQGFAVLDSTGQEMLRLSRVEVFQGGDLASRAENEEFRVPVTTREIYYSPVWFDEANQEPLITLAIPLVDLRSGAVSHVLLADLRLKPVWDLFATLDLESGEDVFMIDAGGRVIAHRNPTIVLRNTTFTLPEDNIHAVGLSNDNVILGTYRMQFGDQEFTVVSEQSYAEAAELATSLLNIAAIVAGVTLVVAIVLAVLVVRQIVRPVENLSETARLIAKGDLGQRAEVTSQDEIGTLAESFNNMTSQLQTTLESERAARLEAQAATRAKDMFLATMSHELRTPLNAMIGFMGLMLYSDQLDEDNYYMAERAIANAERLLSLINNILDLSRITVGRLEIIPVEVRPRQLAKAIQDDMALRFKEKGLAFEVTVDEALPEVIIHDEERLFQIATNLVGNAIKFTEEGQVSMDLSRRNDRLIIRVSDTGVGIPAAKQQIIFDEFVQVDSSSTRSAGGAGLGLSIVKQLAILMHGNVGVASAVNEGATFTVDLPLDLAAPQTKSPQSLEMTTQGA
jgi:signal transduction histidine kinase